MGKEKSKKQQFEFNPADYDYMDKMPLEGWFWEIIRRTEAYRLKYKELANAIQMKNISKANTLLNEIYRIGIFSHRSIHPHGKKKYEKYFFLYRFSKHWRSYHCLPKPEIKYNIFLNIGWTPIINGLSPIICLNVDNFEDLKESLFRSYVNEIDFLKAIYRKCTPDEDNLCVFIKTTANIKDIKRDLLPKIKGYLKPKKIRIRTDKWKYYLIAYDLKDRYPQIEYENMPDLFLKAYPYIEIPKLKDGKVEKIRTESANYFTPKNCEYFYKSALALIKGEYKKYFY